MFQTPIGTLSIFINGKSSDFPLLELPNKANSFVVDKRYQIELDLKSFENQDIIIECILKSDFNIKSVTETGEALALISFYHNNTKLSIGFNGDICNVDYEYLADRIRITIPRHVSLQQIKCNIAWLTMHNVEQEEVFTWFAADPTLSI